MAATTVFAPGGYRYIPAVFQYSSGVGAEEGYEIERVRFLNPIPLLDAFAAAEAHLKSIGRPVAAFAQCELRSPAPFSDDGFVEFNKHYVATLERWGLYKDGVNPVARTNVCPVYDPPAEPSMHAFSYTVPAARGSRRTFALSGGGDAQSGSGPFRERRVRPDDTSPDALREKMIHVINEMERRLKLLGFNWEDAVCTRAYTVQNIGHLVGEELARRRAVPGGALLWYYARLPILGMEYEMDVQGAARELIL